MAEWSGKIYNDTSFWGLDTTDDTPDFQDASSKPVQRETWDDCKLLCNNTPGCNSITYVNKLCYTKGWKYAGQLKHKRQGNGDSVDDRVEVGASGHKSQFRYPVDPINAVKTTIRINDESQMYGIGRTRNSTAGLWTYATDGVWGGDAFEMPGANYNGQRELKAIHTVGGFTQVCPDLGVLSDVEIIVDPTVDDGNYYKANCVYNTIDSSKIAASWSNITNYFTYDANELTKARKLWCGLANPSDKGKSFENIISNQQCTGSEMNTSGVDWKLILLGYVSQTPNWYKDATWCGRFSRVIVDSRPPQLDTTNHLAVITACLAPIKTDTSGWTSELKTAFNTITNTSSVPDFITTEIKGIIKTYCDRLPNKGKDAPECGCKNAVEGWKTDPKTCTSSIKGCEDVSDWIATIKTLSGGGDDGSKIISQIGLAYNVRANSQACKDSETNSSGVLAYGIKEVGASQNIQVCNQSLKAESGGVIKVAYVDFSCIQGLENKTSTPTTPPDDGTPGDGTPGDGTSWKILGLPAWLFFVIISVLVIAIIGGALFLFL